MRFLTTLGVLALLINPTINVAVHCDDSQNEKHAAAGQKQNLKNKPSQETGKQANLPEAKKDQAQDSLTEKKKRARWVAEDALAGAPKINPPEYGILVRVEAAALLWDMDREQSIATLKGAVESLRKLLDE